ncbi:MAG: phosphoribosylaminoimidazolesuccinocarboxamide synthase [Erysipelotrichaceae bacterium]
MTMLYEGKAKQVFTTENPEQIIVHYKDDATAGNGAKKGSISNKGVLNNKISSLIFKHLETKGVKTHLVEQLNERDQLCQKVEIIPLEVICRNYIAGSAAIRYQIEEGTPLETPIYEICWKEDKLNDVLIADTHAISFGLATREELDVIYSMIKIINHELIALFKTVGIQLVDFKIEFGKNAAGEILLADEISPDTCRFWDIETKEKLDKDRFRRDLGKIEEAYIEVLKRLENK